MCRLGGGGAVAFPWSRLGGLGVGMPRARGGAAASSASGAEPLSVSRAPAEPEPQFFICRLSARLPPSLPPRPPCSRCSPLGKWWRGVAPSWKNEVLQRGQDPQSPHSLSGLRESQQPSQLCWSRTRTAGGNGIRERTGQGFAPRDKSARPKGQTDGQLPLTGARDRE